MEAACAVSGGVVCALLVASLQRTLDWEVTGIIAHTYCEIMAETSRVC